MVLPSQSLILLSSTPEIKEIQKVAHILFTPTPPFPLPKKTTMHTVYATFLLLFFTEEDSTYYVCGILELMESIYIWIRKFFDGDTFTTAEKDPP